MFFLQLSKVLPSLPLPLKSSLALPNVMDATLSFFISLIVFSSIFFNIIDAEFYDLLLKYRTSWNAQRFRLLIFILVVARRFSKKEAGNFSSQVQVVSKSAGTLWPSNSANSLALVLLQREIGNWKSQQLFLKLSDPSQRLRHCTAIVWRNILQTCWRICSAVLSRHRP